MNCKNICRNIILPYCPSYHTARQVFNRSIQKYPSAILYCESEAEAALAVRHAARLGQTIRVRSGGHNYEGYCVGDEVLTIDTSLLKNVQICENTHTVKIGSGVLNGQLYRSLSQFGYPFPSGTCPTVSAAGLTQGGGWGHSARMFGLACDSLVETELVDAGGRLIVANKNSNPDLFWALRGGGGGNFGIVTSLTYRLPPKVRHVTFIDIEYYRIQEPTAFCFFQAWQEWTSHNESRFTPNSRIYNSARNGMGIYLRGFFYGSFEEAQASVRPFLDICGAKATFRTVTFEEAMEIDASIYPSSEKFRFAGRFADRCFCDSQIHSILRLIKNRAEGSTYASVALYAMGGNVRCKSPCDTAFFYRNANYIIGIETIWDTPFFEPDNLAWIFFRFQLLRSLTLGSYINFPYLHTDHYMRAYYGGNAERLIRIKEQYDPKNLFSFPQSIRPL